MKRSTKVLISIAAVLAIILGASAIYLGTYEKPTAEAIQVAGTMEQDADTLWFTGNTQRGYLIYPGGKVDERAYAPFAQLLASRGDTVVISRMPFRLAILDTGRASSIMAKHPEVTEWVLVGHSLGGTAASMYLAKHPEKVTGIVFLASYPSSDLSGLDIAGQSFLGERDSVLGMDKYNQAQAFFPVDTTEVVIAGGNHSGFGSYGLQGGDTEASISAEQQQEQVARDILGRFSGL